MRVANIGDPRLQALFASGDSRSAGVKPIIRLSRRGMSSLPLGLIAGVGGILLFLLLDEKRMQPEPAITSAPDSSATTWAPPPPLYIPPAPAPSEQSRPLPEPSALASTTQRPPVSPPIAPRVVYVPQPAPIRSNLVGQAPSPRVSAGPALVIDDGAATVSTSGLPTTARGSDNLAGDGVTRVRASAFANPSMTVPQGYVIPAVLETGFDSTKPGFARAIVSRDVRGFDGKNVLIPRGSRLVGEYGSGVARGQKRALITWTRLIRPDGMTVELNSPAIDPLGRGGIAAHSNGHFLARFGDALLQSTLGLGSALAQRAVTGPAVLVPGGGGAGQVVSGTGSYAPTLTVAPGKSISVFVAHDLDFSGAGLPN